VRGALGDGQYWHQLLDGIGRFKRFVVLLVRTVRDLVGAVGSDRDAAPETWLAESLTWRTSWLKFSIMSLNTWADWPTSS
jgi:hypothetical protein